MAEQPDTHNDDNNDKPPPRQLRSKGQTKAVAKGKLVETTNSLNCLDFFQRYALDDLHLPIQVKNASNASVLQTGYEDASTISKQALEACLDLIEQTSAHDYKNSEAGWSRAKKKKEMKLPDMKYITLNDERPNHMIAGFVSFMITYEDGFEVVYVYEIHLAPEWQAQGLGKSLIIAVETIGKNVGAEKIMLTVFKANRRAVDWYCKLGYVEDEFSPEPRKLRNGTVKEPTYVIFSKRLRKVG
ncbi:uncharacterized protein A1O9_01158 [Exophiala aquamarina CBS 119918]|uniref:N-alpha-acetyltransferase 40 n=1 Tax=Exophiala aquamarina CBS 119918 TaxID=1182545 RepID=A0A072PTI4_9EURO|nr:uncharacterized protein A1O9_01158 [Exophiala aquamarina CBS 119918]KEF63181.1 hypothetical protein A1O9_01158 [Exophiala aquamarina CBS 119918]